MSEKIQEIYLPSKSSGAVVPILMFLVILSILGTLYANVQRKLLRQEEKEHPCNPRYVFFSGLLNPFQKDPWGATERNFRRCVTTHMYRDRELAQVMKDQSKEIETKRKSMDLLYRDRENRVKTTKEDWEKSLQQAQQAKGDTTQSIDHVFTSQYTLHEDVKKKTSQVYYVLDAIFKYIYTVMTYQINREKLELSIETRHKAYMDRYVAIYAIYKEAHDLYRAARYSESRVKADMATRAYKTLTDELYQFRSDQVKSRHVIQKGCRRIGRAFNKPQYCNAIFPYYKEDVLAFGLYNLIPPTTKS